MAIHKSKSTNLSNQEIHILLHLIIFTFRLLQDYITSILGLFLFSYLCTLPLYVLSELYFAIFSCLYLFSYLFVTCVINYFLATYKSQKNFSRKKAWYSEGLFRWGSHRLSHLYKQFFFVCPSINKNYYDNWLIDKQVFLD